MKRFYLITNEVKDPQRTFTKKTAAYIKAHGGEAVCVKNESQAFQEAEESKVDCALVLGGDGTVLRAARNMMDSTVPLLGVNLGTLGYLSEVESASVEEAIEKLLRDEYVREERMMLSGRISGRENEEEQYALNDIVISRCGSLQILNVRIYVNGRFLNNYGADGVIVATPTGSTGYNLSAGGPIVEPSASLLLLTPICPHTLNTRSIVFSGNDQIRIRIGEGRRGGRDEACVTFDGDTCVQMKTGDHVEIRKSEEVTRIMKINQVSFLEVLRNKLSKS